MVNLCTLFDSSYLERGIALYKSLEKCCEAFKLYIVALDKNCYDVLKQYKFSRLEVVRLEDIENNVLKEAKKNRSYRAYCWTCSAWAIKYFMIAYNLEICTYVDADEYFYSSPQELVDSFEQSGCSVGIIGHHFGRKKYAEKMSINAGKYCVQFNTFKNDKTGMEILSEWCKNCAEICEEYSDGKNFGDQKYVEEWPKKYKNIFIYKNIGAGIAPWNIYRFTQIRTNGNSIYLYDKIDREVVKVYFVHFHNLVIRDGVADINIYTRFGIHRKKIVDYFYNFYIKEIVEIKKELERNNSNLYMKSKQKEVHLQKGIKLKDKIKRKGILLFLVESFKYHLLKRKDYVLINEID